MPEQELLPLRPDSRIQAYLLTTSTTYSVRVILTLKNPELLPYFDRISFAKR